MGRTTELAGRRNFAGDFAPQDWRLQPRWPLRYPVAGQQRHLTSHGAGQQAHCPRVEPGDRGGDPPPRRTARRGMGQGRGLDRAGTGLAIGSLCRARCFQPAALRNEVARHLALAAVIPRRPLGSFGRRSFAAAPESPCSAAFSYSGGGARGGTEAACGLSGQRPVSPPFSFDFQDVASGSVLLVSRSLSGQNLLPRLLQTIDVDGPSRKCIDNSDVILIAACARGQWPGERDISPPEASSVAD